jgi:hypothetical protein
MPRMLNKISRGHELIPGAATRAPLGSLSCPYTRRDVVGQVDQGPGSHQRPLGGHDARLDDRSGDACPKAWASHAAPGRWCSLTTDYWNPPTSESQHARQRILAVIVAFFLATILAQAGW